MIRRMFRHRTARSVLAAAIVGAASAAFVSPAFPADGRSLRPPQATTRGAAASTSNACGLLAPADIAKVTGITVKEGTSGPPMPGTLGRCTWLGGGNTRVILTLGDASHMELTLAVQQKGGGVPVSGVGSKAVVVRGAPFTGGGYILTALDAKGGFGVSILGKEGTQDLVVALAKLVASRR